MSTRARISDSSTSAPAGLELYRQLADAMPQLVWTADREGNEEYYNSRLSAYLDPNDVTADENIWHRLLHPDDHAETEECWRRALASGDIYECEHRLRMRDGTYRWHLSRAHAALDAQNNVVKWFGTATDIDATKRAELNAQFLVELESRLRAVSGMPGAEYDALHLLREHLMERLSSTATAAGPETLWVDWRMLSDLPDQSVDIDGFRLCGGSLLLLNNGRPLLAHRAESTSVEAAGMGEILAVEWREDHDAPVLLIPVLADGRPTCVLYVRAEHARLWRADEVALVRDVANRLWFVHDRARVVDANREHEARLRFALDAARMGSWELDITSGHITRSAQFDQLFGYAESPAAFDLARLLEHVHPLDRDDVEACINEAVTRHTECSKECRVIGGDGVERWIWLLGSFVTDASGAHRLAGLTQDITERRLADIDASILTALAELIRTAESEDVLHASVSALIGAHLAASRCFFAEIDEAQDSWHVRNDFVVSTELARLAGSYRLSLHSPEVRSHLREGRTIVVRDTTEDELTRQYDQRAYQPLGARALLVVPLLRDGRWVGAMAAFDSRPRQWTSREQTLLDTVGERVWLALENIRLDEAVRDRERAVRRSDDRYRTLFECMGQAVCVIEVQFDERDDPVDYMFLEANPVFEQYTGVSNVVGRRATEFSPGPETRWLTFYGNVAKSRQPAWVVEHHAVEDTRWFDVYAFPFEDPSLHRVAVFISDVTDRRQTEATLRDADRRKDEFLATLAHELRNPLAPLRTGIELLQFPDVTPDVMSRTLKIMDRQLRQLVRLVDDLLDISRITRDRLELRIERVQLQDVVASAIEACRALIDTSGHSLAVSLPAEPVEIDADFTRLAQVCSNLLNNAARYTPPGGHIALFAFLEGEEVVVRVSDNGLGIGAELLTRIFDPFVQGDSSHEHHSGGLGVGLTLVRRIVEMHNGRVSAKSAGADFGSEFELRLPIRQSSVTG